MPSEPKTRKIRKPGTRHVIDAAQIEFIEGGNTIWVHSPRGATIMRIQVCGGIKVQQDCQSPVPHVDLVVPDDATICLPKK